MPTKDHHPAIIVDEKTVSLSHLNAFDFLLDGKGPDGEDLMVLVRFSNHTFTKRATHGGRRDVQDESGTWRTFCEERYETSKRLPILLRTIVKGDSYVATSKDFNKGSNLVYTTDEFGKRWAVYFCFTPMKDGVALSVLSAYPVVGDVKSNKKMNKISYFARKCLFNQTRVP